MGKYLKAGDTRIFKQGCQQTQNDRQDLLTGIFQVLRTTFSTEQVLSKHVFLQIRVRQPGRSTAGRQDILPKAWEKQS